MSELKDESPMPFGKYKFVPRDKPSVLTIIKQLTAKDAEIAALKEDCKNLASERDGLETLKADLEKKDALITALRHDYALQGQAYGKVIEEIAAANDKLATSDGKINELENCNKRYEKCFERIAIAYHIRSPLILTAMAKNNDENYAEILARFVEEQQALAIIDKKEDGK